MTEDELSRELNPSVLREEVRRLRDNLAIANSLVSSHAEGCMRMQEKYVAWRALAERLDGFTTHHGSCRGGILKACTCGVGAVRADLIELQEPATTEREDGGTDRRVTK